MLPNGSVHWSDVVAFKHVGSLDLYFLCKFPFLLQGFLFGFCLPLLDSHDGVWNMRSLHVDHELFVHESLDATLLCAVAAENCLASWGREHMHDLTCLDRCLAVVLKLVGFIHFVERHLVQGTQLMSSFKLSVLNGEVT